MAESFLRTPHGKGASSALVRVEVPPVDELAAGVHAMPAPGAPEPVARPAPRRRGKGAPFDSERARAAQARAVEAQRANRSRLRALESLGLSEGVCRTLPDELVPYLDDADSFARAEVERLAASVGGGIVPPNVASIVQSAALQLAGSRMLFARGDVAGGSRLANDSRQNLLAAHELAAREAKARPRGRPEWEARLFGELETEGAP